jgi:MFS family permease
MSPASTALPSDAGEPADLRRNLEVVSLGWVFGSIWVTATAGVPLTRFATELHASPWQFGLLTAMPFLASLLSLPASLLIEHTGARKTIFLAGLYFQRALWFAVALLPLWIVSRYGFADAPRAVFWFLLLTFFMHAGNAVGGPAWVSWMADLVPGRLRGKYFARRRQLGILPALPVAVLVGWLLDRNGTGPMQTLQWCAIIFMCAAVCGLMDIHLFHYVPDVPPAPRRGAGLLRAMVRPLRDRRFLVFGGFTATMTFAMCFMTQFVSLYLIERLRVTSSQAQVMLIAGPMLAQLLVLGAWGAAADRMGKKPVLVIAGAGLVPVGLGWVLVGPGDVWLGYLLMAAGAALWTGVEVANFNLVLGMAGAKREDGDAGDAAAGGTAYVATNSVIINVAGCLGGLAAGLIAQALKDWSWQPVAGAKTFTSYDVLFVISGVLRLVSVVGFLPYLSEPGAKPVVQTLRFMAENLCAAACNVLAAPARLVGPLARPRA